MSEATATPNKRRAQHDDANQASVEQDVAGARKRRAFLQTMGQQLREFGTEGASPQTSSRTTFGPSPEVNARPTSRAANLAASHASVHVDTPESDAAPGEDDQLPAGVAKSASKWLWRADEVIPMSPGGNQPFVFEDLLDWSQSYFDHWHPAFPFLHAPALLEYFRQLAHSGLHIAASSPSNVFQHVILRSIMSISVADRRQMSTSTKALPANLVFHSFNDAINSIQLVLTDESSIISLQALVSVQLFLITMHRYNAASRLEGVAVRIAFQLGLYRCPMQTQAPSNKEAELRKRLFWSIFCIDRYLCIRLGSPLGIRSDDVDVCYPHAELHVDVEEKDIERDDRLDLLDFLARHASIRGSIMENRQKAAMHGYQNESNKAMEVEAEHTKWWNMVDEYLSDDDRTQTISKAHQVTLIVLRYESVLALHRSVLATSKKNAAYNAALQRCISASRSIINTLHKALQGFGAFDGSPGQHGYESTPLLWPSFTWAVWMSAFIMFCAATEQQVPREVAFKLTDRSVQILKHLALRGTSWPDACIVAIQNLQTRLRGPSTRSSTVASRSVSESRTSLNPSAANSRGVNASQNRRTMHGQIDQRDQSQQRSWAQQTLRGPFAGATVPTIPSTHVQHPHYTSLPLGITNNAELLNSSGSLMHYGGLQDVTYPANSHLAGSGTFLGIAQQSSDNPLPNDEIMHLFNGEGMADWLGGGDFGFSGNMSIQDNFN